MNWLRLLWPRGLAGQIAACVIASLLISQVFTALLAVTLEPRRSPPPLATAYSLALIITALDAVPASDRLKVSAAVREQGLNIEFVEFIGTVGETERHPTRYLLRALKERLGPNIPLQLDHIEEPGQTELLIVGTRLRDGTPVRIEAPVRDPPSFIAFGLTPFLFYLPFLTIALTVLTFWVTRRVTAPLRAFAQAAEKLGNQRSAPPLIEKGPAELQRAAHSFNKMQKQIRQFIEDRTRTLAAIGHDLRTPITRIRLRVESAVENEHERQKLLQDLRRLDAMVTSALLFLRDGAAEEPLVSVDLASLLVSVCDEFNELGYDVRYRGELSLQMRCRPELLKRAVTNLIENATKYGSSTEVNLLREGENEVSIRVDDDGPGIPDEEKEKAFDPFYRLDVARGSDSGGFGLGLSIARGIVDLHRGRIELLNRLPKGLRVSIRLPVQ